MDRQCSNIDILQELLNLHYQRNGLFSEMLQVTLERSKLNEEDQLEEIVKNNDARQEYIKKIEVLNDQINKVSQKAEQLKHQEGSPLPANMTLEWKKITDAVDSGRHLVAEILDIDRVQKEKMELVFLDLKGKLIKIRFGRKMLASYRGRPAHTRSKFIDRKK